MHKFCYSEVHPNFQQQQHPPVHCAGISTVTFLFPSAPHPLTIVTIVTILCSVFVSSSHFKQPCKQSSSCTSLGSSGSHLRSPSAPLPLPFCSTRKLRNFTKKLRNSEMLLFLAIFKCFQLFLAILNCFQWFSTVYNRFQLYSAVFNCFFFKPFTAVLSGFPLFAAVFSSF